MPTTIVSNINMHCISFEDAITRFPAHQLCVYAHIVEMKLSVDTSRNADGNSQDATQLK